MNLQILDVVMEVLGQQSPVASACFLYRIK
jgi:hypothetical protein